MFEYIEKEFGSYETYRFALVVSRYDGKILLSRHQDRDTWETQGGQIEEGETPLEAAKRELWEESGAVDYKLFPLCDYFAQGEAGCAFFADIQGCASLPRREMAETKAFAALPENLTYPDLTPRLVARAKDFFAKPAMRTLVRRINEWDAPTMLKIYAPYVQSTNATEEVTLPTVAEYVQRIDRYTYGRGWIMSEINGETVGFCLQTENREDPEDLFSSEIQLFVKPGFLRRHVGMSLYSLMLDMMNYGNKRRVIARIALPNAAAVAFHKQFGFVELRVEPAAMEKFGQRYDVMVLEKALSPVNPTAEKTIKPYLIESADYEKSRIAAGNLIKE